MASSYTGLGTELMTTGENAGTWGSTTNTNLQILEQIAGGYTAQSIAGSAQTTTLSVSDGSTGAVLAHRVIEFTGTITGNQVVTVPLDVQTFYIMKNNTSGAYTVQFKYVSGSGSSVTWAATDKGTKLIYAAADHASNPNMVDSNIGGVGAVDLDGNELTLDADSDTSITASTDDQIDIEIAGADDFTFTANAFNVLTGSHATFADSANAKFGTGNDMLVYHDGSNSYITNATGALKIATETSGIALTIGHTTSETTIADNLTTTGDTSVGGTLGVTGVATFATHVALGDSDILKLGAGTDLTLYHDGSNSYITNAVGALKVATETSGIAVSIGHTTSETTVNDNLTVTGTLTGTLATAAQGNVTSLGTLTTLTVDNVIVNGTTIGHTSDTDLLTLGSASLTALGTITVGVDDTGHDVKFFGATSGSYALWDESADSLLLTDSTPLKIGDAQDLTLYHDGSNSYITNAVGALKVATETSGIAVTIGHTTSEVTVADNLTVTGTLTLGSGAELTEAELEFLDGITAGTAAASKAMVLDASADITGGRNLTISGELDAATLDISGNADIDGTTNLDAVDVDGAVQIDGTVTVGVDDTGLDVKFFGASAGAYLEWDESADELRIMGASADATTSTGKLLLATSLTDINANDVLGKIDFQAPHEAGGTDAITVAASIRAIAQGTFSASVNATDLVFYTGHSEAATEKYRFTSEGEIGIGGANYGTDGQVLTSGGAGAAAAWEDASSSAADDISTGDGAVNIVTSSGAVLLDSQASTTTVDGHTGVTVQSTSSGDITLDSVADIVVDAAGGNVEFKDAGTLQLTLDMDGTAGEQIIQLGVNSDDLVFKQYDGTEVFRMEDGGYLNVSNSTASSSATTGSAIFGGGIGVAADAFIGDDLTLISDSAVLGFGADTDTTLTHTDGTGLTLNSTNKLCFNDASQFIQGSSATVLSIGATDEIDLTATAVDLNGTLNVSGVATFQATPVFPDGSLALADLDIDGGTDIGADIVDADLFIIDDGAGGTNRKTTAARVKTYIGGGTSWQAVKTGAFTASAGQGVFVNTTSSAFTITLPAGTIGDEVSIIDYAGTFDSNNCTIAANGSEKIHGSTDDLTVATERAAFTLVFTDSTQGWLLKDK